MDPARRFVQLILRFRNSLEIPKENVITLSAYTDEEEKDNKMSLGTEYMTDQAVQHALQRENMPGSSAILRKTKNLLIAFACHGNAESTNTSSPIYESRINERSWVSYINDAFKYLELEKLMLIAVQCYSGALFKKVFESLDPETKQKLVIITSTSPTDTVCAQANPLFESLSLVKRDIHTVKELVDVLNQKQHKRKRIEVWDASELGIPSSSPHAFGATHFKLEDFGI